MTLTSLHLQILIPSISPHLSLKDLVDPSLDRQWLLSCQHPLYGGIAREPKAQPGEQVREVPHSGPAER